MKHFFARRISMAAVIGFLSVILLGAALTSGTTANAQEVNPKLALFVAAIEARFAAVAAAIEAVIAGQPVRTVHQGTCISDPGDLDNEITTVSAPEVTLADPPLVQVWIASSLADTFKIDKGTGIMNSTLPGLEFTQGKGLFGPAIGEGKVLFSCPAGWVYSVTTLK